MSARAAAKPPRMPSASSSCPMELNKNTVAAFRKFVEEQAQATGKEPDNRQSRVEEEFQGFSSFDEVRALLRGPYFWKLAALLPNNNIHDIPLGKDGRPRLYPDYMLFFVEQLAARDEIGSRKKALRELRDPVFWRFVMKEMSSLVPRGWTKPTQMHAAVVAAQQGPSQHFSGQLFEHRGRTLAFPPAPRMHHVTYFQQQLRGKAVREGGDPKGRIIDRTGADPNGPFSGVIEKMIALSERISVELAQAHGLLNPDEPLHWREPDPRQWVGFDGVVFKMPTSRVGSSLGQHHQGDQEEPVYGTKFTIASTRQRGVPDSRIILSFAHNSASEPEDIRNEAAATVTLARRLLVMTAGGMKGIYCDSVIRGRQVEELQRAHIAVVNFPHAKSNPKRATFGRKNPERVEKTHLAATFTHVDVNGVLCEESLYWVGGELVQAVYDSTGKLQVRPVRYTKYKRAGAFNRESPLESEPAREYLVVTVDCPSGGHATHQISLFHGNGPGGTLNFNWGEYARILSPNSDAFKMLYAMRNDTESRHRALKRRIKHMPIDVPGQYLRLLAATVQMNSLAWLAEERRRGNQLLSMSEVG